ncbi:MAG: CHAT domain-containing protein [Ignavibacteriaceae bacterium]|nr:CHAT domain-containing protein [Ignavibacteriaceae bacterium]
MGLKRVTGGITGRFFLFMLLFSGTLCAQWEYSASYNEAIKFYEEGNLAGAVKSMELAKETYEIFDGDLTTSSYAVIINNLALFYNQLGDYTKAGPLFEQALKISRALHEGDDADLATMISNLASFYNRAGRFTEAEQLYLEAWEMRKRLFGTSHIDIANSLNNIAAFYKGRGRIKEAEKLMSEALAMTKEVYILDNPEVAVCLNNLGLLYYDAGRHEEALPLLEEALSIRKNFFGQEHPEVATTLTNLASVYYEMKRYSETEAFLTEALDIRKKILNECHPDIPAAMNNLAAFYSLTGRHTSAVLLYGSAISSYRKIYRDPHPDYALALNNLAVLYLKKNDLQAAEKYFEDAVKQYRSLITGYSFSVSEKEREQYLATILSNIELFASFSAKRYAESPGTAGELYNNALLTKGFLLNSSALMRQKILGSGNKEVTELYERFIASRELLAKVSSLSDEESRMRGVSYDSLKGTVEKLEKQLSLKSGDFAEFRKVTEVSWQDIRSKLKPGEAAVEVIRSRVFEQEWKDSVIYIVLILENDSQHPVMVILPNGEELETKILFRYRQGVRDIKKQPDPTVYQAVWAPVSKVLGDVKRIYFSPDGFYNQINLLTLFNPESGRYLADELDVIFLTNSNKLSSLKPEKSVNRRAILAGFPDYNAGGKTAKEARIDDGEQTDDVKVEISESVQRFGLSDLPGTKTETEKISAILKDKGYEVKLLHGVNASEESVKNAGNPDILHLATHGFFLKNVKKENPETFLLGTEKSRVIEDPMYRSGLFFAGAAHAAAGETTGKLTDDNGIFTAFEAANMNLNNTRVVVLSACETGLGEIRNGEGVYGLRRAFIQAGAGAVIMSLWKVDDESTQQLMSSFYGYWMNGESKHDAFRKAVLAVKEKYQAPYYWGAFIMTGL